MRLYLDSDGVLADFDTGVEERLGMPPDAYDKKFGPRKFWRALEALDPGFYTDLPLMPDAMDLFRGVALMRPIILSGCPLGGWSEMQKIAWAKKHFPGIPMITCMTREKPDYCLPGDVLIDDSPKHKPGWEAAGGIWITHTSAASSLAALREVMRASGT